MLSFAQFEREVTSERIRDKIAASKRKGLWVGGVVPLGYKAKDRKITIVENEAKTVRHIYRRYLELGSIGALLEDLRKSGITTKRRPLSTGKVIGGIPFGRGPVAHLLRNRFYIGEVKYRNEILRGEQKPILDRKLFDAVQAKLDQQRQATATDRNNSEALLTGIIFDDRGNRMTPTSKLKKGVRYRYYISNSLIQGQSHKRPIRSETRAKLVQAIAQGRHWVDELISGSVTSTQQIASREQCSPRQVNLIISLAFLSPTLVKAAVDGHLPRGIGISTIRDLPELWAAQHRSLGLQA